MSLAAFIRSAEKSGIRITGHSGVYTLPDSRGRKPFRLDVHFQHEADIPLDEQIRRNVPLHAALKDVLASSGMALQYVGYTRLSDEEPYLHTMNIHAPSGLRHLLDAMATEADEVVKPRIRRSPRV